MNLYARLSSRDQRLPLLESLYESVVKFVVISEWMTGEKVQI
jgi:hypothetical protein